MKIREITSADLHPIFEVRVATWHNERGAEELAEMGITISSVQRMMRLGTHKGWLCETDDRIVGFAMGDRSTGEMWVIGVLRQYQGQRIGRALLAEVENWLESEGCSEMWLTTDVDETMRAVGFYRHLGWKDWKLEDGDRYMKKHLGDG